MNHESYKTHERGRRCRLERKPPRRSRLGGRDSVWTAHGLPPLSVGCSDAVIPQGCDLNSRGRNPRNTFPNCHSPARAERPATREFGPGRVGNDGPDVPPGFTRSYSGLTVSRHPPPQRGSNTRSPDAGATQGAPDLASASPFFAAKGFLPGTKRTSLPVSVLAGKERTDGWKENVRCFEKRRSNQ